MLAKLKQIVTELTRLEARADKYREKQGRIDIAPAERQRLVALAGGESGDVPDELTIEAYVALIDAAIAAVLSRLDVDAAVDELIAAEM